MNLPGLRARSRRRAPRRRARRSARRAATSARLRMTREQQDRSWRVRAGRACVWATVPVVFGPRCKSNPNPAAEIPMRGRWAAATAHLLLAPSSARGKTQSSQPRPRPALGPQPSAAITLRPRFTHCRYRALRGAQRRDITAAAAEQRPSSPRCATRPCASARRTAPAKRPLSRVTRDSPERPRRQVGRRELTELRGGRSR